MRELKKFVPVLTAVAVVSWCGATARSATISGEIVDENGGHPPAVVVMALSVPDWQTLTSVGTADGGFTLSIADNTEVALVAVAFSGRRLGGYDLHGYTMGIERVTVGTDPVDVEIGVHTCHELILEGRRADGTIIRLDDLPPGSSAVDDEWNGVVDGLRAIDGVGQSVGVPSMCIPSGEFRRLSLRYELPGAGLLNLVLDRDGAPFDATNQGAEILDLNESLARSQLVRLDRLADEIRAGGDEVPVEFDPSILWNRLSASADLAAGPRAAELDEVAAQAVITLEDLVLWRADRDALVHRRGDLEVVVLGPGGVPVSGAAVEYRQLDHDFGFGFFEPQRGSGGEVADLLQGIGLNSVTAGTFWREIESAPGVVDWDYIDNYNGVGDLTEAGWRVKGHPLTWFSVLAMPSYLGGMDFQQIKQRSVDHVRDVVSHYRGVVSIWDVSNEASGVDGSGGLSREQMDEYLVDVFASARAADPEARLVLNNHFDVFGQARIGEYLAGAKHYFTMSVPAFVRRCIERGVDFDIIGQQLYNGGVVTILSEWGLGPVSAVPTYDLGFVSAFLDELGSLGKPVHITEHSVPSAWDQLSGEVAAGYWRRPWSEEIQAEYMDAFLRIAFGHPAVQSVTWWNALDREAPVAHGGLIRQDGVPKAALGVLQERIAQWTSVGVVATDSAGRATVRGYAGAYELTVTVGGFEYRFNAHITEETVSSTTFEIDPMEMTRRNRGGGRRAP